MKENDIQREIRLALGKDPRVVLWRNNVGFASDTRVRYGLAPGSADLVGLSNTGRFIAIEVKTPGGRGLSDEQRMWLDLVRRMGGVAGVARSVDEALALVEESCS